MPTMARATMTTTAPTTMAISVPELPPDDGSSVGCRRWGWRGGCFCRRRRCGRGRGCRRRRWRRRRCGWRRGCRERRGRRRRRGKRHDARLARVRRQRRARVVSEQQLDLHQARRPQVRVRERQRRLPFAIEVERYRQVEVGERRRPRDQARRSAFEYAVANRHRLGRFPVADADGQRAFLHRLSVEQRRPLKQYRPRRYAPILILILRQRGVPAQQRRYRQRKRQRHPPARHPVPHTCCHCCYSCSLHRSCRTLTLTLSQRERGFS